MDRYKTGFWARWGTRGLLLGLAGCVEPYMPDVINAPNSYLVVDGFINGNGVTLIKLSRTINISTATAPPAETKATVYIVDDMGLRYAVRETSTGLYNSDSLLLKSGRQYQLRITTAGASAATYESELVPLKITPAIDKLSWVRQNDLLTVQLGTHDAQQQSRYYRWNFVETWQFNSAFESVLEYKGGIVTTRTTPIYTCWRTERPSAIKQGSTAQLSQDALTDFPILSFSDRAERLKIRYSVLVNQYAETAAEFAYYELLRKNTEAVGTVNDPLPSQLSGNVHRVGTTTSEPVLGFVGAHTVQQQRLFIDRPALNLPSGWSFEDPYPGCTIGQELAPDPADKYPIYVPFTRVFNNSNNIPIDFIYQGLDKVGYTGSSRACADCRVRGINVKPVFW